MSTRLYLQEDQPIYGDEEGPIEFVGDEVVAKSYEQGRALVDALFSETTYAERYANTPENLDTLIRVCQKLNQHDRPECVTRSRFIAAYKTADAAGGECGDCGRLEKLPAPVATTPRARNNAGRFQNPYLQELDAMLSNPNLPASAITERMRVDAKFREAVESSGRSASASRETASPETTSRVRSFAAAYRAAPSLRFVTGYVAVGDKQYTRVELDDAVEEASRLGLL
jgi:hypothetical protein